LNQALGSDAVHEAIGVEPVIDQFELGYRHELSGSFSDDVNLGNLITTSTANGLARLVQGVRDRKLSWLNARNVPPLSLNASDVLINPSKAFRAEPWFERAGWLNVSAHVNSTERYWDSMMPSIADCFAADGTGIFTAMSAIGTPLFGHPQQVDPNTSRLGWIYMDQLTPQFTGALPGGPTINGNWNRAYPFEPRYAGVARQVDISKTFIATYAQVAATIVTIPATVVNGFCFGSTHLGYSIVNGGSPVTHPGAVSFDWLADANLTSKNSNGYYVTSSANVDDVSRGIFGFGDRNTCFQFVGDDGYGGTATSLLGTNHLFDRRDVEGPHPDGVVETFDNNFFMYSPLIRGWKYGVHSGTPCFSKAYWRRGRFGQLRDMLEQRPFTKYYQSSERTTVPGFRQGAQPAVVEVRFVDPQTGLTVPPSSTRSSNLSLECTSSVPYLDGHALDVAR